MTASGASLPFTHALVVGRSCPTADLRQRRPEGLFWGVGVLRWSYGERSHRKQPASRASI